MTTYAHGKNLIRSGDLLAWSSSDKFNLSHLTTEFIRAMTRSEYAHVAIAWWLEGRLFCVEATMPVVRLVPITDDDTYYHIPARLNWTKMSEEFLLRKIGLRYSVIDGVRAYFGLTTENDNKWQCAELAHAFYRSHGMDLGDSNTTPSRVVKALCLHRNTYIRLVHGGL